MPTIDASTYNKAATYPQRHGYQLRGAIPTSIVVHSTGNKTKNTLFTKEAEFLFKSSDVSAHYLVGKDGAIVQFLDPRTWQAWHAGTAIETFSNARSIGIELHHSLGDAPYPAAQLDALAWLLRRLAGQFGIMPALIETHGQIALPGPYDRKHDPTEWSHDQFIAWRDRALTAQALWYRTTHPVAIFETPTAKGPVALKGAAVLNSGETVAIDEIRVDGWAHLADGVGFVPVGVLVKN